MRRFAIRVLTSALSAVVVATVLFISTSPAQAAPPSTTAGTATGMELTARWWQVALSTNDLSFWNDSTTGGNCRTVNLPAEILVMVAGTLGGPSGPRACDIPSGATVVLPVLNEVYVVTGHAPSDTVALGRHAVATEMNGATVAATVDGVAAGVSRIRSSRFTLDGTVFGLPGMILPAVSDGYWLVLSPTDGSHNVTTSGTGTSFSSSTTYHFVVG
jgi:hypothetical protein